MNRGVEIAAEVADATRVARHRTGRERRRGAHGRPVVAARLGRPDCLTRRSSSIRGGRVHRRDRRARSPTCCVARRRDRRGRRAASTRAARRVLDAEGCVVAPGLVDIQVHFREPGREEAETIETGARAAALGGSPRSCACRTPTRRSTTPRWSSAVLERGRAGRVRRARRRVHHQGPRAARSSRRWASSTTSACASSPTTATASPTRSVMRRAFEYAAALPGAVIAQHAEDPALVARRAHARRRVVEPARHPRPARRGRDRRSSPATSRSRALTGGRVPRPAPVDRRQSVELVRAAKADGRARSPPSARRTTSRSPTTCCAGFDPVFKMNPPLRTEADVARDPRRARRRHDRRDRHRPRAARARDEGACRSRRRRPGMLGARDRARASCSPSWSSPACSRSRDALAAAVVAPGRASPGSTDHGGPIAPGAAANLCVFDPPSAWVVDAHRLASRSREHAVRRLEADRQGAPHDPRAASRSCVDGEAYAMSSSRDARAGARRRRRCSRAWRSAHRPEDGVADRRGRVQHRARRATRRSSPTRRTRAR